MSWEEVEGVFSAASSTPLACTQQCRPNKRPGQVTRDTAQVAVNMADGAGVSGGLRLIAATTPFPLAAPETMHAAVGRAEHVMQGCPLLNRLVGQTDSTSTSSILITHDRGRLSSASSRSRCTGCEGRGIRTTPVQYSMIQTR